MLNDRQCISYDCSNFKLFGMLKYKPVQFCQHYLTELAIFLSHRLFLDFSALRFLSVFSISLTPLCIHLENMQIDALKNVQETKCITDHFL